VYRTCVSCAVDVRKKRKEKKRKEKKRKEKKRKERKEKKRKSCAVDVSILRRLLSACLKV